MMKCVHFSVRRCKKKHSCQPLCLLKSLLYYAILSQLVFGYVYATPLSSSEASLSLANSIDPVTSGSNSNNNNNNNNLFDSSTALRGCFKITNPALYFGALGRLSLADPEIHSWMTPAVCLQHCARFHFTWALIYQGNACRCAQTSSDVDDHRTLLTDNTSSIELVDNAACHTTCSGNSSLYCGGTISNNDQSIIASLYYIPATTTAAARTAKVAMASEAKEHVPIEFSSYDCAAIASGASLGSILFTGISCALFYWCYLRPSLICIRNQRRYGNDGIGGGSIENMALSSSSASPSVSNTTGSKWWHYLLFKQSSNNQLRLHNDCNNSKGGHRSSRGTTQDSDDSENDADITSSSTDERHGSKSNRHYGSSHGSTSSKGGRRARSGRSRYRQSTPTNDGNLDEIRGARRWWKKHLGRDRSKTVASSNHSSSIKSDQSVLGDSMEHSNLRRNVTKSHQRHYRQRQQQQHQPPHGKHQASGSLGSISTAPSRIGGDVDYEYYYGEESDSGDGRKHSFHVDRRAVMRGIEAGYSPYSGIGATGSVFPSTIPSRNSDGRQQQHHHHLHQHGRSPSQRSSLNDVFPPLSNGLGHPSMMNQEWYDLRPAGPGIGSIASDLHDSLDYTPRLRIANPSRCYSGNLTGDSASEISSYTFMTNITNNNSNNNQYQ